MIPLPDWVAISNWIPIVLLLILGLSMGTIAERRHLRSLAIREGATRRIRISNMCRLPEPDTVQASPLVMGQAVIATDYFKTFATQLRNLLGGEMRLAQRLMIRARREALLRMIREAIDLEATEVHNVRFEFCNISELRGRAGAMQVEILAYGTAVIRSSSSRHGRRQPTAPHRA